MNLTTFRPARWFPLLALLGLLTGCAYQLGPTNGRAAGADSVEVRLFTNRTIEPRLSEPLAQALRKRLQQDGTFRLATRGEPDVLVTGEITDYWRNPVSFQPADILTPRDYEVRLAAQVRAVNPRSGQVLLDRKVTCRTLVQSTPNLANAERQAVPLAAEELARTITTLLVDGEW